MFPQAVGVVLKPHTHGKTHLNCPSSPQYSQHSQKQSPLPVLIPCRPKAHAHLRTGTRIPKVMIPKGLPAIKEPGLPGQML